MVDVAPDPDLDQRRKHDDRCQRDAEESDSEPQPEFADAEDSGLTISYQPAGQRKTQTVRSTSCILTLPTHVQTGEQAV